MKIIKKEVKFYRPTDILKHSNEESEICDLFSEDLKIINLETRQSLLMYYYEKLAEKKLKDVESDIPENLKISVCKGGHGYEFSKSLNKSDSFELCFDSLESDILAPADEFIDDLKEGKVDFENMIPVTEEMIEQTDREVEEYNEKVTLGEIDDIVTLLFNGGLERAKELLESYNVTYSGYIDEDGCDDIKIKQDFKIVCEGKEYQTAGELPNKYDALVVSAFFEYMGENIVDWILECFIGDVIYFDLKLNDFEYLQDYSYNNNNNKNLEDTDFYKWFEDNKILISEDKKLWIIDEGDSNEL